MICTVPKLVRQVGVDKIADGVEQVLNGDTESCVIQRHYNQASNKTTLHTVVMDARTHVLFLKTEVTSPYGVSDVNWDPLDWFTRDSRSGSTARRQSSSSSESSSSSSVSSEKASSASSGTSYSGATPNN